MFALSGNCPLPASHPLCIKSLSNYRINRKEPKYVSTGKGALLKEKFLQGIMFSMIATQGQNSGSFGSWDSSKGWQRFASPPLSLPASSGSSVFMVQFVRLDWYMNGHQLSLELIGSGPAAPINFPRERSYFLFFFLLSLGGARREPY